MTVESISGPEAWRGEDLADDDGRDCDRLLYRLWLSMPNSRPLPPGFEVLWGSIEAGALRGGIEQPASR